MEKEASMEVVTLKLRKSSNYHLECVRRELNTTKKLKVAVVGCGFVAQKRHIPAFLRLKNNVLMSAVCDLNPELAKSVAAK
ncbi:MAG: hypothetical protein QXK93_09285, partial [Candidatus Bathyarchaeia archaeon]